jgi:prepilin-type N-terminal cleavage/methylation domain-containing protein
VQSRGFSLVELMITVALIGIMAAMSIPVLSGARRKAALYSAQRDVAAQIRTARYSAVTGNKVMRVRFNCPSAGRYRVIEVTGNATIDNDTARCSYPWPDFDSANLPDSDGPVVLLPDGISFNATQDLEIDTRGQITPLSGASPATIRVTDGSTISQVTAATSGRVRTQ